MMLDTTLANPAVVFYQPAVAVCGFNYRNTVPIPLINDERTIAWLNEYGISADSIAQTSHCSQSLPIALPSPVGHDFPFRSIEAELRGSAIVFGNLECPLSTRGRRTKNDNYYRAHPGFGPAMAKAGFSIVSFANNHAMDFGEIAFLDTLEILKLSGVMVAGALEMEGNVRRGHLLTRKGIRVAFIGYNFTGPEHCYAIDGECGVVPLNEITLRQDIALFREAADWIVVSVHWGAEGSTTPTPQQIVLAHQIIDLGADIVVGHHSHVPGSIEIYKGKPIFYSLGNFIFGHGHLYWSDNMIVHVELSRTELISIEVVPIGSRNIEQFQPRVIDGNRASHVLDIIRRSSSVFNTCLNILEGARGQINLI